MNDFTFPPVKAGEDRRNFSPGTSRRREENHPGEAVKSRGKKKRKLVREK